MTLEYISGGFREQLSSIFGSISFASWIIVMVPQLVEQWRLKTVEGISLGFLLIWFLGDVLNLIGSLWAGLLPEVILIAFWFLFGDILTLGFYAYIKVAYDNKKHHHHHHHPHHHNHHNQPNPDDLESAPIVGNSTVYGSTTDQDQGQDHHLHHAEHVHRKSHVSTLEDIVVEPEQHSIFIKYILPILMVIFAGVFGSLFSPNGSSVSDDPKQTVAIASQSLEMLTKKTPINYSQVLGYLSAFLYLVARLPQMYRNHVKKSTNGLSLLFFLFTMLGNITYSLQIITFRSDWEYIKLNMGWLIGSIGTVAEDLLIVYQFYKYRNNN